MENAKVPKDILPTLIVGLGGTGYQIIKRLKQLFSKRYGNKKLPVRYLLIDTDLKSFLDDSIENNEKCQLRFGDGIKNTLEWAYNNPNFDWMPKNPKITPDFFTSTDQGAGLMRPIGRLYLCKNAKLTYDILQTAKNDLVDLHKVLTDMGDSYLENIDRHKVYIVGSLAGGTGCGTFLDVAVMLSKIFNRDTTNIIGLFTLESCYDDKLASDLDAQNRSKANCYAALKELEFYMSSITDQEDEKYNFKYSNIGEIKLDRKLLDVCYLIENRNEMGGVLTNIEDIYDLCSLQLFQEIGTTLGSQLRADYANFICKDKDPVLKRDRHFSTFSSSSMEFPIDNLKKYCAYKLAYEIFDKLGRENTCDEQFLEEEAEKILEHINTKLDIERITVDFAKSLKITDEIYYEDLKIKKGDLDRLDRNIENRKMQWQENKNTAEKDIKKSLDDYINVNLAMYGSDFVDRILKELGSTIFNEYNQVNITSSIDKEEVKKSIDSVEQGDRKVKSGKKPVDSNITSNFNTYLDQEYKRFKKEILKERYQIYQSLQLYIKNSLDTLLGYVGDIKSEIKNALDKISCQSKKNYGGSIIAREMLARDFYDEYYNEKLSLNLENRISSMFKDINLMKVIKCGSDELVRLCSEEFEKVKSDINIMYLLKRNAEKKGISLNEYVKNELNVTAKLCKPFWSAVKNPEVAWTECYYIGCMKDESINNGLTIKAPEPIDNWIRNQTGERSRWARYVETPNLYSIDVIHITMGACAAYLPDIKNYKHFYLKLLASKTYPLHLDEKYIGLEELDKDLDDMMTCYSLAKAYGAILEIENASYINIKEADGRFTYVYRSEYCLESNVYKADAMYIPENISIIPEELKLGDSYHETIKRINEDMRLGNLLMSFIKDANKKFKTSDLEMHCLNRYIKDKVSKDFIAREKLNYKIKAN
jgi:hypothetical protein